MKTLVVLIVLAFFQTVLPGCSKDEEVTVADSSISTQIINYPKQAISEEERVSLLFMREEEKLARDVYRALYEKWNHHVFQNISASEQRHMDAVLTLLEKYDISDPVGTNDVGVFVNENLQALYLALVDQSSSSLLDAFMVGATIEDLDIFDLQNALDDTDNDDITFVYNNLLKGSRNHMRAFYKNISNLGGEYEAQYLTQTELLEIVESPKESGGW